MDEKNKKILIGTIMVVVGLLIAGFGGTGETLPKAILYIVGFLIALSGLKFFYDVYRLGQSNQSH